MTDHAPHAHGSPLRYLLVFLGLLVLTVVTYVTGRMHLGGWALPLALVIASTKAGLVLAFFMHLWDTRGAPLVAMAVSLLFIVTLLALVFGDVVFRFPLARPDRMGSYGAPPVGAVLGNGPDGHAHPTPAKR
jgi:cytochrome c oxidase subunit 4